MAASLGAASEAPAPIVFPGSNGAPFPLLERLVAAFSGLAPSELLIFGDSVMERVSKHDSDHRTLGTLLEERTELRVLTLTRSAFNPALADALLGALEQLSRPRYLLLPVNLRSFSPQWDLNPAWAVTQELAVVERWKDNPAIPISPLEDVRETPGFYTDYEAAPVAYELSHRQTVGAFRKLIHSTPVDDAARTERAREIFIYHYTAQLHPGHRKVQALVHALATCRRLSIEPWIYITPINHATGTRLAGPRFGEIISENVREIRRTLAPLGLHVKDLTSALPSQAFFHENIATEHLNQAGRCALAERLLPWKNFAEENALPSSE